MVAAQVAGTRLCAFGRAPDVRFYAINQRLLDVLVTFHTDMAHIFTLTWGDISRIMSVGSPDIRGGSRRSTVRHARQSSAVLSMRSVGGMQDLLEVVLSSLPLFAELNGNWFNPEQ